MDDKLTDDEARLVLRAERLCDAIDRRVERLVRLLFLTIGNSLARATSILAARRWAQSCLLPAKRAHPLGLYALKHEFEFGTPWYIREGDFAAVLTEYGIRVVGDKVFAKDAKRFAVWTARRSH